MRLFSRLTLLAVSVVALSSSMAMAATSPSEAAAIAKFRTTFKERAPAIDQQVESVQPIPSMNGWYELDLTQGRLAYADVHAEHLLMGQIIDLKTMANITKDRYAERSRFSFDSLPFKYAIKEVRGNGQAKVALFEDPNCHYCAQMEAANKSVTNVTIYHFVAPILGADSVNKTTAIWCSKDQAKAWRDWMIDHKTPEAPSCDAPLQQVTALFTEHHFAGTPTIVFEDGTQFSGSMSEDVFEKQLAKSTEAMKGKK